jgi:predicted DNA-binding transcriptional regulator AlpA
MKVLIDGEEYIEREDVIKMTGMGGTVLYEKMRYDRFPKPEIKLIPATRRRSLWKKSDIEACPAPL